jgi:hypothetical protein
MGWVPVCIGSLDNNPDSCLVVLGAFVVEGGWIPAC